MDEAQEIDRGALFQELWVDALAAAGEGSLLTTGGCMLPTLASGDRVLVERLPPDRYRVGDVVVYRGEDSLVAHRLVGSFRVGPDSYLVHRGDNSRVRGVLAREEILGRVSAILWPDGSRIPVVRCPPPAPFRLYYSNVAALRQRLRHLLNPVLS